MDQSLDDLAQKLAGSDPNQRRRLLADLLAEDLLRLEKATGEDAAGVAPPVWLRELLAPATSAKGPALPVNGPERDGPPSERPPAKDWLQMLVELTKSSGRSVKGK